MNTDTLTDDEALRITSMTDGAKRIKGKTLRPVTATSFSWMGRSGIFEDADSDSMQKTAVYVYLHTEPKDEIRSIVNNRAALLSAVDEWMDANIAHHADLEPYSEKFNESMQQYLAASSRSMNENSTPRKGGKAKN